MTRQERAKLGNVLFVHQAAEMYGSDKVLLYLVTGLLRRGRYWPIVVVPEEGPLVDALRSEGVEVHVCEIAKVKRLNVSLQALAAEGRADEAQAKTAPVTR